MGHRERRPEGCDVLVNWSSKASGGRTDCEFVFCIESCWGGASEIAKVRR
jgi:hypothetical protein